MNDMVIKVQPARPAPVQAPYVEVVYVRQHRSLLLQPDHRAVRAGASLVTRRARVNDFVRVDGRHWLVCLILHRCVEGDRMLVCFRDGVRRTIPESRVEKVVPR